LCGGGRAYGGVGAHVLDQANRVARPALAAPGTLAKARRQLAELQARISGGHTRTGRDGVQAEIDQILRPRWVSRVLTVTLTGQAPPGLRITYRTSAPARRVLENEIFGKRILFTDRSDWPPLM
jgi:hypothetical protein